MITNIITNRFTMLLLRKWNLKIVSKAKFYLVFIVFSIANISAFGQITATFTTTVNTICNGSGCNYSGPSILINELMISFQVGNLSEISF